MAARFWVGGTGTWDASSTTNWSATSGGAAGASAPTTADTVTFDSASGTGIVTTAAGATCSTTTVNSSTIELSLGADFTQTGAFTLTLGTVTLNSYNLTSTTLVSSNSNVRTINFGTGKWTLSGSGTTILNCGTMTGLVCTGTKNVEFSYSGSTGTRSITPASAAGGATESNCFNLKFLSGTDIVAVSAARVHGTIDFDGFAGSFTTNSMTVYGNLELSTGMTISASTGAITFAATSGTKTITTNGKTIDQPVTFDGVGGSWQLQDNLTIGSTRRFTLTNGTVDLNNYTFSCGDFNSSNSNVRALAFGNSGILELTGNNKSIFSISNSENLATTGSKTVNATYNGSTGTRSVNGSGSILESNAINFNVTAGSDSLSLQNTYLNLDLTGFSGTLTNNTRKVYYNFTIPSGVTCTDGAFITTLAGTTGTSTITTNGVSLLFPITVDGVGGTFVFNDVLTLGSDKAFTLTNGTVKLKAGATSTVGAFATSGSNQKYLQSTTAGSQATLSQASGTVTVSYLSIKDIAATGGATWNAYVDYNNVDQGDNTGWDFSYSPAIDNEFPVALRSFTQPKRF